jgi:hypothetical protein
MLDTINDDGFCVQAGAAIVFTSPASTIHRGNVCAFQGVIGGYDTEYQFTGSDSALFSSVFCDPTAGTATDLGVDLSLKYTFDAKLLLLGEGLQDSVPVPVPASPVLDDKKYTVIPSEIGGQTFYPGIYFGASLTIADSTEVYLKGDGKFTFISGSTLVTGANTKIVLEKYDPTDVTPDGDHATCIKKGYLAATCSTGTFSGLTPPTPYSGIPTSANIEWVATAAATLGASSEVKGTILAGAAATLGADAKVSGCILALAAVNLGANGIINADLVASPSKRNTNVVGV